MNLSIGSGNLVVTQRQGNGSYRNYFGVQVPGDFFRSGAVNLQDLGATRTLLLSDFYSNWAEEYKTLIEHATDFRAWPLYTLSTEDMDWQSVAGVTLLGDAAHLAITNGEGVNLAMQDALELANKIAEYGIENVDRAVREYETDMFPRGKETTDDGWTMANVMFSEDPQAFLQLMKSYGA
jgi:2-polyprenyl-6-methoxyphenol hydroxylase-like FAD-dependent oxidoreductase